MGSKPKAFTRNPITAVLKPHETFEELARQVQYVEISWPQCYQRGEPLFLVTGEDGSIRKRNRVWTDEENGLGESG